MKGLKKALVALFSVAMIASGFGATKAEASAAKRDCFDDRQLVDVFPTDEENPDVLGVTKYALMVGNVQVTSENMNNIPGVRGKASYDPNTKTLTLTNVTGIEKPYTYSSTYTVDIYSELEELRIVGTAQFTNGEDIGILARDTELSLNANLKMKNSVGGIMAKKLRVNGGNLDVNVDGSDKKEQEGYGIYSYKMMDLNAGTINAHATTAGIGAKEGDIYINGGRIEASGSERAIGFHNDMGRIQMSPNMRISKPVWAEIYTNKIKDSKGYEVKSITIIPVKALTGTVTVSLDPKNADTLVAKVTDSNAKSFDYQWYREGRKISKATGSTYKVTDKDLNKSITCGVTDAQNEMTGSRICDKAKIVAKDQSGKIILKDDPRVQYFFRDIMDGEWYVSAVQFVYENGVMNGTGANTFEPMKVLTRAEFVTVLHNLEGKPDVAYKNTFKDVPKGKWFTTPVMWAYKNEITSGVSKTEFGTDTEITREQLATMLYKYAKLKKYKTTFDKNALNAFYDKNMVSSWATEAMQWAVSNGVMSGKAQVGNYKFLDPTGEATRAECAQMIKNLCDNLVK